MRTSAHRLSAPSHEPSSRASTAAQARNNNDTARARPPSYGIAFADRIPTRISDPDEAHERAADRLAHDFLAKHSSTATSDTPSAFGRFAGRDLSRVRIHRDARADALARSLGTGAFTFGDDITVARGRASTAVLAHELAHVVAQRSRPELAQTLWREPPKDEEERLKQKQTAGAPKKLPPPPKKLDAAAKPGPGPDPIGRPVGPVPFVHPFILAGLPGDLFNRSLTDRYRSLRPNGTEWYGAWTLGWSLLNPLMQPTPVVQGGSATPGKWDQDYTRFSSYVSALQRLTPGKGDPYLDVASLATGTRVEDWISHDRFLKEALPKYWWQALIGLALAQGAYSGYSAYKNADPGAPGSLATDPTFRHFGMLTGLAGMATKSKFLTLGNNPLQFGIPIANEAALPSTGPLSAGLPGAGLTLDFQKGVGEPGARYTFGMPFNVGRLIRPDEAGKPKSPLELGAWGSYDQVNPTPTMLAAGSEASKTWSAGAAGGYNWMGALDYRYRQTGGMELHQGSAGLGYLTREPADALKAWRFSFPRFGVAASYANWSGAGGSVYGPRLGSDKGDAWRISPYLDVGVDLGRGYSLSAGGQASATFRSGGTDMQKYMDGLRVMMALQHQKPGTPDADKKRLEVSYSQNRYEWMDPNSPLMHGVQLKGQWGPWFGGAQANWMQGGLKALQGTPYARDFANSSDPLRDLSLLFMLGYRFGAPNYSSWGFRP